MKKIITINYSVLTLTLLFSMFFFLSVESMAKVGCDCSGTVVKFNWEKGGINDFVLEPGDDAHGITISNVVLDASNEPNCFDWASDNPWVISVCIKLATDYETTDYPGGSSGGSICTDIAEGEPGYHAISHIEFCVDEALPVELSSFTATISNNVAQLNWETATEVNNYGFEIQRASETEEWNKLGFVAGHGNSNSPKYYTFIDQSVVQSGNYSYRLKQIDIDGAYEYSDIVNITLSIPDLEYKLNQNYPNPFNPSTTISYTIPEQTHVNLVVYNIFGEEITRLVNDTKEAGNYSITFNAENLATGLYFYTIQTESYTATKKLILLK